MTGEELFDRYGKDVLGPWDDQDPDVQRAWEEVAAGVTDELAKAADQLLGTPPYDA